MKDTLNSSAYSVSSVVNNFFKALNGQMWCCVTM